jgi:hypothetical protein
MCRVRLKLDGTRAETRFRLSPKRTSPFKPARASVQLTAGSRGVRISGSKAGYNRFRGSVRVLATHYIRQFPLHFPSRASPCAITFKLDSTRYFCIWSHSGTLNSVGLPWTSDQPDAETSTWQHATLTGEKLSCPRRDSNPQSQQAGDRRPTP